MSKDEAFREYDRAMLPFDRLQEIAKSRVEVPVYRHESDLPDYLRKGLNHAGVIYILEQEDFS